MDYGGYGDFQIEKNVDFIQQLIQDNDLDERGYFIYHGVLKAEMEQLAGQNDASSRFINIIRKYTYLNDLSAEILNALIDRILVHHKEVGSDGREYQQIEIHYRFIGRLDAPNRPKKIA